MKKILPAIVMICSCYGLMMAQGEIIGGISLPEKVRKNLVYRDPAKSIEIATGQEFTIELDANATTGYQWQLAEPLDKKIIELLSAEYRASETSIIGAGGKEIWKFRAVARGNTIISMKYIRAWEKDIAPIKNIQFRVLIYH